MRDKLDFCGQGFDISNLTPATLAPPTREILIHNLHLLPAVARAQPPGVAMLVPRNER
jgi:hypothetical protein